MRVEIEHILYCVAICFKFILCAYYLQNRLSKNLHIGKYLTDHFQRKECALWVVILYVCT